MLISHFCTNFQLIHHFTCNNTASRVLYFSVCYNLFLSAILMLRLSQMWLLVASFMPASVFFWHVLKTYEAPSASWHMKMNVSVSFCVFSAPNYIYKRKRRNGPAVDIFKGSKHTCSFPIYFLISYKRFLFILLMYLKFSIQDSSTW